LAALGERGNNFSRTSAPQWTLTSRFRVLLKSRIRGCPSQRVAALPEITISKVPKISPLAPAAVHVEICARGKPKENLPRTVIASVTAEAKRAVDGKVVAYRGIYG